MKIFVVGWATASQDDNGNCSACGGIHNMYTNYNYAKKGLVELKDEFYDDIVNDYDNDNVTEDDVIELESTISVYGSVEDHYFEIDYEFLGIPNEVYIYLEEKEIIEG